MNWAGLTNNKLMLLAGLLARFHYATSVGLD